MICSPCPPAFAGFPGSLSPTGMSSGLWFPLPSERQYILFYHNEPEDQTEEYRVALKIPLGDLDGITRRLAPGALFPQKSRENNSLFQGIHKETNKDQHDLRIIPFNVEEKLHKEWPGVTFKILLDAVKIGFVLHFIVGAGNQRRRRQIDDAKAFRQTRLQATGDDVVNLAVAIARLTEQFGILFAGKPGGQFHGRVPRTCQVDATLHTAGKVDDGGHLGIGWAVRIGLLLGHSRTHIDLHVHVSEKEFVDRLSDHLGKFIFHAFSFQASSGFWHRAESSTPTPTPTLYL